MKHVGDGAFVDDEGAVHIGFAEFQFRIEQHLAQRAARGETDRDRLAGPVAESENALVRQRHPKIAAANKFSCNSPK